MSIVHDVAPNILSHIHLHIVHASDSPQRGSSLPSSDSVVTDSPQVKLASYFEYKSAVDRVLTAGLMIFALPVMAAVGMAVLALDGRPVFYRQTRVGKNGRLFRIWKFRTMRPNAERETGAVWSIVGDPRVTRLGSWLRSSHLDELPQFLNVLAGDMNLIGPRPERPEFVNELARELPVYLQRLRVAPGITGLAQIRNGYDHSVADVRRKVSIDLEYIRSASLSGDATLLAQTGLYITRKLWTSWIRKIFKMGASPAAQQVDETLSADLIGPQFLSGVANARQAVLEILRTDQAHKPRLDLCPTTQEVAQPAQRMGSNLV